MGSFLQTLIIIDFTHQQNHQLSSFNTIIIQLIHHFHHFATIVYNLVLAVMHFQTAIPLVLLAVSGGVMVSFSNICILRLLVILVGASKTWSQWYQC